MAVLTQPIPANTPAPAPPPDPTAPPPAPASDPSIPPPQPAPGSSPPGGQQQAKGPPLTMGPVDPELLKKFVANCMNVVTAGLAQIIKMVKQTANPVEALARAAVMTIVRVEDSLEQHGLPLNLNMTFEGGAEAVTDIADAMGKAGVHDYTQQEIDAAFLRGVDQYRILRQQQGRLDPAMFQQIIQQMKQSQTNGTLDQQFPGLTNYAKQVQKSAKPGYQPNGGQPAPSDDGDGADAENAADQQADESTEQNEPPDATAQGPTNNFPAHMLKPKKGQHVVASHLRRNPGTPAPKMKPKAKTLPKAPASPDDFPATMLKERGAKGQAKPTSTKGAI